MIETGYIEFSTKLKYLKSKTGTTQKQLAKVLSVCSSAISAYESGKHLPGIEALVIISKYFNVSIDYLIGLSDNPYLPHDKTGKPYVLTLTEGATKEQKKLIQRFAIDLIEKGKSI